MPLQYAVITPTTLPGPASYRLSAVFRAYGRVQIIVKARYARKTADRRYDAGPGNVVGVITAYCQGMTKCPNWVNE
ncbi:hypothetical protein [Streptomyces sp. NRRL B-24572]|uniref:hypothetical protein n=1 Tax=Streptomyces sp. NRRL B-24572 TaxID=1962156 RepID=UPI0015C50B54|nr:hypothetical protein [Streptomyces sp. NRRL B-24572]